MFHDRMKQIEEDIVPFGFIDDGSSYIDEVENGNTDWYVELE